MLEQLLNNRIVQLGIGLSLLLTLGVAVWYFIQLFIANKKASKEQGFIMQIIPPKYSLLDAKTNRGKGSLCKDL